MKNPHLTLGIIESKAKDPNYKYHDLYKNLYNEEFYKLAYAKIYAKEGNMTAGTDGKTIDGFSLQIVQKLINSMRNEEYQPHPSRRVMIPKKASGKFRPLGIPAIYDKLVQEILRNILQAIYEPNFSKRSHGFRPNKSCHTALLQVKETFTGTKWWIEGDIKCFFDNIDHHILIGILKQRIEDERFIRLIWKFLRAGYIQDFEMHKTFSGTPQGGIISPILANIYLDQLDKTVEKIMDEFNTTQRQRRSNAEYKLISEKIESRVHILKEPTEEEKVYIQQTIDALLKERETYRKSLPKGTIADKDAGYRTISKRIYKLRKKTREVDSETRQKLIEELKELRKVQRSLNSGDNFDPNFRKMKYVRYADDFLIGIIGNKKDAETTKQFLKEYLSEKLKLELSQDKTYITHSEVKVRFLGFDIFVAHNNNRVVKTNNGSQSLILKRTLNGGIKLSVPHEKISDFILGKGYGKDTGKGTWKATHQPALLNNDPLEMIMKANMEIRGLYNYYHIAFDAKQKFSNIHWIWEQSVLKSIANKHKTQRTKLKQMEIESNGKKYKRYYQNGQWGVAFERKGIIEFRNLLSRKQLLESIGESTKLKLDTLTPKGITAGRTSILDRLNANKCEYCGDTIGPFEVHHIKKLKDLRKKSNLKEWEKMHIARNRKTMVLCGTGSKNNCHNKLHKGTL